jgi:hypothetical protein
MFITFITLKLWIVHCLTFPKYWSPQKTWELKWKSITHHLKSLVDLKTEIQIHIQIWNITVFWFLFLFPFNSLSETFCIFNFCHNSCLLDHCIFFHAHIRIDSLEILILLHQCIQSWEILFFCTCHNLFYASASRSEELKRLSDSDVCGFTTVNTKVKTRLSFIYQGTKHIGINIYSWHV